MLTGAKRLTPGPGGGDTVDKGVVIVGVPDNAEDVLAEVKVGTGGNVDSCSLGAVGTLNCLCEWAAWDGSG